MSGMLRLFSVTCNQCVSVVNADIFKLVLYRCWLALEGAR